MWTLNGGHYIILKARGNQLKQDAQAPGWSTLAVALLVLLWSALLEEDSVKENISKEMCDCGMYMKQEEQMIK